jgi:hypothetical protein
VERGRADGATGFSRCPRAGRRRRRGDRDAARHRADASGRCLCGSPRVAPVGDTPRWGRRSTSWSAERRGHFSHLALLRLFRAVSPGGVSGPPPDRCRAATGPGEAAVTVVHARGGRVTSRRRPRRGPAARCPAGGGIRASSGAGGGAHRPRGAPLPEPLPEAAGTALPQISTPRPPRTHRCWRCVFTQRPGNRCVPAVPRPFRGRAAAVSSRGPRNYRQGPPVEMQSPHVAHCGRNPTARGGAVRAAPGPSCRPGAARPPAPPQAGAPTALRTLPVVR